MKGGCRFVVSVDKMSDLFIKSSCICLWLQHDITSRTVAVPGFRPWILFQKLEPVYHIIEFFRSSLRNIFKNSSNVEILLVLVQDGFAQCCLRTAEKRFGHF